MSSESHLPSGPAYVAGDKIAGKYRVERVLGSGGMGVVYAARHEDLGQLFAIKFLRHAPGERRSPDTLAQRFVREARAAAQIQSDHVVRVFDVGTLDNGDAYMVMEHLAGEDLDKLLEAQGALPVEQAVAYVMEALDAVAHAHALGIVHRDLKPSNLFAMDRPDGSKRIKVLDFGISKVRSDLEKPMDRKALTTGDAVLGSPGYMAPEQVRKSKNADARSDIWSLGVILYELLTGASPFRGETVGEVLASILDGVVEPPRRLRPSIPEGLEAIVLKCLMPNAADRFQDAVALASALSEYCPAGHREIARRIGAVVKASGAEAKGEPVRISLSPGLGRISQTAETMDATIPGGSAPDIPRLEPMMLPAVRGREPETPAPGAKERKPPLWVAGLLVSVLGFLVFGWMMMRGTSPQASDAVSGERSETGAAKVETHPQGPDPAVMERQRAQAKVEAQPEITPAAPETAASAPAAFAPSASAKSLEKPRAGAPVSGSATAPKSKSTSAVPADLLRERD